jgi:hypothetical protein
MWAVSARSSTAKETSAKVDWHNLRDARKSMDNPPRKIWKGRPPMTDAELGESEFATVTLTPEQMNALDTSGYAEWAADPLLERIAALRTEEGVEALADVIGDHLSAGERAHRTDHDIARAVIAHILGEG